jgi:hypothetical protein
MDGQSRAKTPPRDVRRAFVGSRLEFQVLIGAYELAAPVIRQRVAAGNTADERSSGGALGTRHLLVQGA